MRQLPTAGDGASGSVHAFDDAHIAFTRIAERGECLLIGRAVVGGNGLFDAVELDRNGALSDALLIGLDGAAASRKAAAIAGYGWSGEFGVRRQRGRIRNSAIEGDPVSLGHRLLPSCYGQFHS